MPVKTSTNIEPYLDDFDETKDHAAILFQPGVSVQTRELNQLQSIFRKQIERFGDNIFKQGTIVSGCNFIFYPSYPYVKLLDNEVDGSVALVSRYNGNFAICEDTGLTASILSVDDGFESTDPDLKTLYLRYMNSGTDNKTEAFSAGDEIVIRDRQNAVHSVFVADGGAGFSNTDTIVTSPRLIINVASGSIANGDYIVNVDGANAQVIELDSTTLADRDQLIIKIKPRTTDLASLVSTSNNWSFSSGSEISNPAATLSARVEGVIGRSFRGRVVTNGSGKINEIIVLTRGFDYTSIPYMTVKSANNSSGIEALQLEPKNYIGKIRVASVSDSVGNAYAFSVGTGVVYQRGLFHRVEAQTIIVEKYGTKPDGVNVGFNAKEEIITYNADPSLRDPTNNTDNQGAPGADRLRIRPVLELATTASADSNDDFFSIVSWNEGNPYLQRQSTVYNKIQDEIDNRTYEEGGDFIVDSFLLNTRSPIVANNEGNTYSVVVDPGIAYISGHRVQTLTNYAINVDKAFDTVVTNNHSINLNYGSYVRVRDIVGVFQFNTGDVVDIYDTAKAYLTTLTSVNNGNTTPAGSKIGEARIRSLVLEDGQPGVPDSVYRLYLFDIRMNSGKNFRNARSIYYNGVTYKGICDVSTELDGTLSSNVAVLREANSSSLLFFSGAESLKNANNVTYTYRTIDQACSVSNTGLLVKSISSTPDEFYPYTGALTSAQMQDLYVVPTALDLISNANFAGTVTVNTTSANMVGSGTSFLSDTKSNDYVYVFSNGTAFQLKRVVQVVNNTLVVLDSNCSFANVSTSVARAFPKNVPVPFGYRSGLSANVDVNQNILTLNFGMNFTAVGTSNVALGVNIKRVDVAQATKTPNRKKFVKICLANNVGGTTGPWCMGVPDIFRLRGVYVGNSSVSNTGPNTITNFYVDHNQNPDFLDLGWLYLAPKHSIRLSSAQYLLVEFDYFTTSSGFIDAVSYVSANVTQRILVDSQPLSNLTSTVNSFEIPEVFDNQGKEYDLINQLDFRPVANTTSTPASTYGAAPINPGSTLSFGNTASLASEKKFPLPGSQFICNMEEFIGRTDSVIVSGDGSIEVLKGKASSDVNKRFAPTKPPKSMKITDLVIPSYPNLPVIRSTVVSLILNDYVINGKFLRSRISRRTISKPPSSSGSIYGVPKAFTHADGAHVMRRLADLEYYVSLSRLEQNVASQVIPSSIDPSLNRFKFGFFADDFDSYAFTERTHPTYSAEIDAGCVVPEKLTWDMSLLGALGGPDYVDHVIVNQENATWPDTLGPVCILQYVTYQIYKNPDNNQNYVQVAEEIVPVEQELWLIGDNAIVSSRKISLQQYYEILTFGYTLFAPGVEPGVSI